MNMSKFSGEQDPGYLAVSTMLWRWEKDLAMYARSLNPREKDRLFRLLVKAAEEGDLAGVTSAIEEGADVNYSNETGSSIKHVPISKIHPSSPEAWQKLTANQYATALQAAVGGGTGIFGFPKHRAQSLEIIQLLLKHRADVNAPGSDYGDALQIAIQTNDIEIVKILLSAGADVNAKRTGGRDCTALIAAASSLWADTTMIKLLLDHGADVNAVGGVGGTALCAAAMGAENGLEKMQVLLAHGAYANMRGGKEAKYLNPLHAAVTWKDLSGPPGYPEGVRLLVEHGAQINDLPERWRSRARKIVDGGCHVM